MSSEIEQLIKKAKQLVRMQIIVSIALLIICLLMFLKVVLSIK